MEQRRSRASRWHPALRSSLCLAALLNMHGLTFALDGSGMQRLAPAPAGDPAAPEDSTQYLELELNGSAHGLVAFVERDGSLWADADTLRGLGFVLPVQAAGLLRLADLPELQVQYDAARQRLALVAPLRLLHLPTTVVNAPPVAGDKPSAAPGALLNYDLYGTHGPGSAGSVSAFAEARAFWGSSILSSTAVTQEASAGSGAWHDHTVRLDTTWSWSDPARMQTLRIGDTITDALSWSRPTRIGGLQWGSNFALQPYRITTPIPAFLGSTTLPSEVDLYVNGMHQFSGQVPAGPFQLNTMPNINGAGVAQVVLTDMFGRTSSFNFSLYDAHQLLQGGLSDWSVELGAVRQDYGFGSDAYGHDPLASATLRRGVSDTLTLESHVELTRGLANGGLGANWRAGQAGIFSAAVAASDQGQHPGLQRSLGYSWVNGVFNIGANTLRTTDHYLDAAGLLGNAPPQKTDTAQVGVATPGYGGIELSYLALQYPQYPASRYASANWFKPLGRNLSVSLSVNQSLSNHGQSGVFAMFTWAIDPRTTVSAGLQHQGGADVLSTNASSPTPSDGGFGWNASARAGQQLGGGQAEVDYTGRNGRISGGVNEVGGTGYAYADLSGALVAMGGGMFATRRIDESFAVVSTSGVPGVPVSLANRPIGVTDADGLLLVLPLKAYQTNQIAIDPLQLPSNVRVDRTSATTTPSDRAGTLVPFGLHRTRSAYLSLIDADGKPLALGSAVRIAGDTQPPALVGFDGAVFLESLAEHNLLHVTTPGGACSVRFDVPRESTGIEQIGPVQCRPESAT